MAIYDIPSRTGTSVGHGLDTPSARGSAGRRAPQGDAMSQFLQFLQQQAAGNKEVAATRAADARNTGGRHLDMSGHDITNASGPWAGPMTFTPRGERAGLQSLTPSGDFSLLTPAGRAPSMASPAPAPAPAPTPAPAPLPTISDGAPLNPYANNAVWNPPPAPGAGQGLHPDIASAFTEPAAPAPVTVPAPPMSFGNPKMDAVRQRNIDAASAQTQLDAKAEAYRKSGVQRNWDHR